MIRLARLEDCAEIARLGAIFHAEAAWGDVVEYKAEDCQRALALLIEHGILLVAEEGDRIVGMAGGMVFPFYFNNSHLTGNEMFFWVSPERRGGLGVRLLHALEDAAKSKGCKSFSMNLMETVNPEATLRFYRRNGYRPLERTVVKVF